MSADFGETREIMDVGLKKWDTDYWCRSNAVSEPRDVFVLMGGDLLEVSQVGIQVTEVGSGESMCSINGRGGITGRKTWMHPVDDERSNGD